MRANDPDHFLVCPRPRPLVLLSSDRDERQPPISTIGVENTRPRRNAGLVAVDATARRFTGQRKSREIPPPILVLDHLQGSRSFHLDARRPTRTAACAITGENVLRVPHLVPIGTCPARPANDTVFHLFEARELGRK